MRMAIEKHDAIAKDQSDAFCLAADTVVSLGHRILGKPEDEVEARQFLKLLSGRRHRVMTAIAISNLDQSEKPVTRLVNASVKFMRLDDQAIDDYIECGEWRGKAGGYGIQGAAARYIQWMEGSYTGIVGLPCFETSQVLKGLGYRWKVFSMSDSDLILVDEVPSYRRVALICDGVLDQIWIDDAEKGEYLPEAIVTVKLNQHFRQHHRAVISLGDIKGSHVCLISIPLRLVM